jgi:hypothetical protein
MTIADDRWLGDFLKVGATEFAFDIRVFEGRSAANLVLWLSPSIDALDS